LMSATMAGSLPKSLSRRRRVCKGANRGRGGVKIVV
jgi:hypothetical protein